MDYKKNLDELIRELDQKGGSDIHFNVGASPAIRVDGELIFLTDRPMLDKEEVEKFLMAILDEKEKAGRMGEDDKFRLKDEMQKIIDESNKKLEELVVKKEEEIKK